MAKVTSAVNADIPESLVKRLEKLLEADSILFIVYTKDRKIGVLANPVLGESLDATITQIAEAAENALNKADLNIEKRRN